MLNSEAFHLAVLVTIIRIVAALEAPTKDSSMWYKNFFKVSNAIVFQWERMNPQIEKSPNWQAAVEKVVQNGKDKTNGAQK